LKETLKLGLKSAIFFTLALYFGGAKGFGDKDGRVVAQKAKPKKTYKTYNQLCPT